MHLIGVAFAIVFPLLVALTTSASAITVFTANLTSSQEVPPNSSTASGFATFVLNDAQTTLSFTATIFGIDINTLQTPNLLDDLVNAHIHCCTLPGANASVRWGFFGTPFHNTDNDLVITPIVNGAGGVFSAEWDALEGVAPFRLIDLVPQILAGQSYINFHTVQFPAGEIRGQILVPEPPAFILFGIGLLVLRMAASRRQKRML